MSKAVQIRPFRDVRIDKAFLWSGHQGSYRKLPECFSSEGQKANALKTDYSKDGVYTLVWIEPTDKVIGQSEIFKTETAV